MVVEQLLLNCIGNRSELNSVLIVAPRVLQSTLGLASFFLNLLIVLAVLMFRILQSKCHYVIMQLSAANGLLALGISIEALRALNNSVQTLVVVDWFLTAHVACLTSVLLWALSLSIDRYVAIFHAHYYRRASLNHLRTYSLAIWVLAGSVGVLSWFYLLNQDCDKLTNSPWTSFTPGFISGFCGLYLVTSVSTVFGYGMIVICTKRKIRKINRSHCGTERSKRSQIHKNESLLHMILLIICSFSFCHLIRPVVYFIETRMFDTPKFLQDILYEFVSLIMLLDGVINCAIYLVKSQEYRQALTLLLTCDWGKRHMINFSCPNEPKILDGIGINRDICTALVPVAANNATFNESNSNG